MKLRLKVTRNTPYIESNHCWVLLSFFHIKLRGGGGGELNVSMIKLYESEQMKLQIHDRTSSSVILSCRNKCFSSSGSGSTYSSPSKHKAAHSVHEITPMAVLNCTKL